MKTISISVKKRTEIGKKATKNLRKEENVPCVLYGGKDVIHFYAHENDFRHLVYTPNVYLVDLDIDGEKHRAIKQDIQFHPVTDKIQHIDFVEVFDDRPVIVNIPIEFQGSPIGIREGGKSRTKRRSLRVKGLPKDLLDKLVIDITNVDIGDVVKVGDLQFDNLELLDPSRSMIYAIVSSRVAMAAMTIEDTTAEGEETAEGAEGAEGEEGAAEGAEGGDAEESKSEE